MPELFVKDTICTRCGLCIKACPTGIIKLQDGLNPRFVDNGTTRCISCGHCESVCPNGALTLMAPHLVTPAPEQVNAEMDPDQLAAYLRQRRSIRNYRDLPVERSLIDRLMDTVRYAPSSSNNQAVRWLIIYNTSELRRLTALAVDWMISVAAAETALSRHFDFGGIIQAWDRGDDPVCRKAPHLVMAYAHREAAAARTDGIIALSHLEIFAPSLGLGACWAGFFQLAASQWKPLAEALDLPNDHLLIHAMMLGYPQFTYRRPPKRNPLTIVWRN
ncbi:MAG: nitroreductase family protein [Desulfuromonadales bacterium]|nr:nitroreductase family protein [Desulfuromonadales bacterium]